MRINVAGAGAGKTTKMADYITKFDIPDGKIVFCIAFTNAAAENIKKKVIVKLGCVPNNIRISTIHSFLYRELITPYYFYLYGKHFERISVIDLPSDNRFKQNKLFELESNNILHSTKIPEKAKWVTYQKSSDCKVIKDNRKKVLKRFSDYCAAIFVDEAQDICEDIKHILEALDSVGVEIILYGDPKQDVKGFGCFREIIDKNAKVEYISNCYRCPQKHLNISNQLACTSEQQTADETNAEGSINVFFESEINDIQAFLDSGQFDLRYISKKNDRYTTHERLGIGERFNTLRYEVQRAMKDKWNGIKPDIEIDREAFYCTEQMLLEFENGKHGNSIISTFIGKGAFNSLDNKSFAQMVSCFKPNENGNNSAFVVSSIEIIKGLEAKRCLFILTTDLAPYLFQKKTDDNKTSHLLYVALTRSKDNLTFLVTKEVEKYYDRSFIEMFFSNY